MRWRLKSPASRLFMFTQPFIQGALSLAFGGEFTGNRWIPRTENVSIWWRHHDISRMSSRARPVRSLGTSTPRGSVSRRSPGIHQTPYALPSNRSPWLCVQGQALKPTPKVSRIQKTVCLYLHYCVIIRGSWCLSFSSTSTVNSTTYSG